MYETPIKITGNKVQGNLPSRLSPAFTTYSKTLQPVNLDFETFEALVTPDYLFSRIIETKDKYDKEMGQLKLLAEQRGYSIDTKQSVVWSFHIAGNFGELCWMVSKPFSHIESLQTNKIKENDLVFLLLTLSKGNWKLESLEKLGLLGLTFHDYKKREKLLALEQALEVEIVNGEFVILK